MGLIFQQNEFRSLYDLGGWLNLLRPKCPHLRKGGLPWGESMGWGESRGRGPLVVLTMRALFTGYHISIVYTSLR